MNDPHAVWAATEESHRRSIARAVDLIGQRYAEPLTLEELASEAAISPSYFSRVFRGLVDVSPGVFLGLIRLQAAKRLLFDTEVSVTEICFEVGYSSLGTFSSRFTRVVGMSPSRFRRVAQGQESILAAIDSAREVERRWRVLEAHTVEQKSNEWIFVGFFRDRLPSSPSLLHLWLRGGEAVDISFRGHGPCNVVAASFPEPIDLRTLLLAEPKGIAVHQITGELEGGEENVDLRFGLSAPKALMPPHVRVLPPCEVLRNAEGSQGIECS